MELDIYGNRLQRGHCEVHPEVPEIWPCYLCVEREERKAYEVKMRAAYEAKMRVEYENQLIAEHEAAQEGQKDG